MRTSSIAPFAVSAAPVDAALVTTAALASPTNDPDEVASVTSRVHIAKSQQTFEYDDDGNQTLITTKTGLWRVTYNGENRPVHWVRDSDNTTLAMTYDHMGRRRGKNVQRFFYNGYQQIADNAGNAYVWEPTEPVATRPLVWQRGSSVAYYTHDGNKNVSEVVAMDNDIAAHYEYAPFCAVTTQRGTSSAANPWRFSSEYAEDDTATVYYNYRHYDPVMGRWLNRDPMDEDSCQILLFCINNPINSSDFNGLLRVSGSGSYTWRNPTPIPGLFVNITLAVDVMFYSCCDIGNVKKNMVSVTGSLTIAAAVGAARQPVASATLVA